MSEVIGKLVEVIEKNVKPATHPVAVKLAAEGDEISQKHRRPSRDFGNPVAACQGMSMARTFGWTVVLGEDDHACPVGAIGAGHIEPDLFLEGGVAELYQDDTAAARKIGTNGVKLD